MTVLVLSHPGDLHATRVLAELGRLGHPAQLIDLADFPRRASIGLDLTHPASPSATLYRDGEQPIPLSEARSVWWRRPGVPSLEMITDPDALAFAHGEWHEILYGLYELLDCPWMNDPARDDRASRKALQLREAARLGLRVPQTLMTSDPLAARGFVERHGPGGTVYKIFAATHQVWRETRLVGSGDLDELDALRLAPVIFQEYVPAVADLRVTVIGRRMHAMIIHTKGTSYEVDFRVSLREARTEAYVLPARVERALRSLMDRFGLVYGAIDLRLTEEGEVVFLEVNPAGEFLFCEHGTGLPLTSEVARWLAEPLARRPKNARRQPIRPTMISA